ncbi:MAG: BatA and WFA domain-containing protein [Thermoguttaceae bacterium]|nr:BatA and WFA domain-containing protein [Thermoguttaceae bacterium]MDW8078538.1 BatA and WFA domain-containing protein [Thermoguttaceae bacterium]
MTFGAAAFLLATLAAIIPVILHLINRQQAKELPFPTLRFLRLSVEKTRRRRRLQDLLLMFLRMAVLVFIAVGLAKPTLTSLAALMGGGAATAVAIVLDNSGSMSVNDEGRPRMETALRAVEQILNQLQVGDQVALFVTCGPNFPEEGKFDRSHEKVRQLIGILQGSFERADLSAEIEAARRLILQSDAPNRSVFVVSDFQTVSFPELSKEHPGGPGTEEPSKTGPSGTAEAQSSQTTEQAPGPGRELSEEERRTLRRIPVVMVDCGRNPRPNVGIVNVEAVTPVPVARVPVYTTVSLLNASSVPQQRAVTLFANGVKAFEGPAINLPPGEVVPYQFQFTFREGGIQRCEVRLVGEDGSPVDDRWYFSMEIDMGVPVAIVVPQVHEIPFLDESFYLENALLAAGGGLRVNKILASQLGAEPLERYKVIFCVNIPALTGEALGRLSRFVDSGGTVFWICGADVDPTSYNQMAEESGGLLLPTRLVQVRDARQATGRDSFRVSWIDPEHPVLRLFTEPASLYQSVLIYRHIQVASEEGEGGRVLARLDDGEPILVEKRSGRGTVLFWGSSAHLGWTNFPLRPIFLPLMARLTFELAGTQERRYQVAAGRPIVIPFEDQIPPRVAEILPPSGAVIRKELKPDGEAVLREFRYSDTHQPGFYVVRLLEGVTPRQMTFAVNFHPDEVRPEKIDRKALEEHLAPSPVVWAENPEDLSSTFRYLREGTSLWEFFLLLVLVGLVCETFVSNFFTPKQERPPLAAEPLRRLRRMPETLVSR